MNSIVFLETLTLSSEVVEEAVGIVLDSEKDQADVCVLRGLLTEPESSAPASHVLPQRQQVLSAQYSGTLFVEEPEGHSAKKLPRDTRANSAARLSFFSGSHAVGGASGVESSGRFPSLSQHPHCCMCHQSPGHWWKRRLP